MHAFIHTSRNTYMHRLDSKYWNTDQHIYMHTCMHNCVSLSSLSLSLHIPIYIYIYIIYFCSNIYIYREREIEMCMCIHT